MKTIKFKLNHIQHYQLVERVMAKNMEVVSYIEFHLPRKKEVKANNLKNI